MKMLYRSFLASAAWSVMLLLAGNATAFQPSKQTPAKTTAKTPAMAAPSEKEIADARSRGMVWVNTNTKVYHKDGQFYGKTKDGKFMTEADAQKAGYRAAKESAAKKKPAQVKK